MSFAQELRTQTAAVRIRHRKLGTRKALTVSQRNAVAEVFHADTGVLSASKRLLNTKHEAFRQVLAVRRSATEYWRQSTAAYPEPGIRLIRRDRIEAFNTQMVAFKADLGERVKALEEAYAELRVAAAENLGELFNSTDYPATLTDEFDLAWEYPTIEPPAYLKELNPALYEQEQQRIAARFEEAVRLTEQALATELSDLVNHLCDKLAGESDGKPKVVRESAICNIKEFFDRFNGLNIHSNEQLESLIRQANQLVDGVDAKTVRNSDGLRSQLAQQMGEVRAALDQMVIVKRRQITLEDDPPETMEDAA